MPCKSATAGSWQLFLTMHKLRLVLQYLQPHCDLMKGDATMAAQHPNMGDSPGQSLLRNKKTSHPARSDGNCKLEGAIAVS